jgi:hypothetical protein
LKTGSNYSSKKQPNPWKSVKSFFSKPYSSSGKPATMQFETLHLPTIILSAELQALNKHGSIKKAARELGITERTLARHARDNNVVRIRRTKEFIQKPKSICKPLTNASSSFSI